MDTQKDDVSVASTTVASKKKNTKKYVLIGAIVLVLAILAFYFLYFIKTPVYSLYEIRTAAQTKNVLLLEERADLNSIYSNAFDDYVSSSLDDSTSLGNPLAIAMVKFMKPSIVSTLVEKTKIAVKNGEFAKDEKEVNKKETTVSKVYPIKESPSKEKAKEKISKMKNFKVTGVKDTVIQGSNAIVSVETLDRNTNNVIIVDLKMKELNDGTWQLVKVDNFKEVLKEIQFPSFNELVK